MRIFTIGYGDRRVEALVSDLGLHGVTQVLDIRPMEDRVLNCAITSSTMLTAGNRYADLGRTFGYVKPIPVSQVDEERQSEPSGQYSDPAGNIER